jgi:tyrosyl-tRNA synthetase
MPAASAEAQFDALTEGIAEVIPREGFAERLDRAVREDRPLRVKLGLDPTAPHVTLGWAVVLRKLRRFQDLGHTAVLIVGDFTARVGDPSGKAETRPRLPAEVVRSYAEGMLDQFRTVVSEERLEIRYNAEWSEALDMEAILRLTASTTVARMLERDDFAGRFAEHRPISLMEFMYPLLQAYDSVAVQADVELGGTDQTFNLLMGRDLQREFGQEPQIVLTVPLLEGLDGVQKMSQSLGNYVGITEPPEEMFGKLMSLPDPLITKYLLLCTDAGAAEAARVEAGLADGSLHPAEEKRRMARAIVGLYHGASAAAAAEDRFDVVHKEHRLPPDVPEVPIPDGAVVDGRVWLPRLLALLTLARSHADAIRLISQGAVKLDGRRVTDPDRDFDPRDLGGAVLQKGRREFVRIAPVA